MIPGTSVWSCLACDAAQTNYNTSQLLLLALSYRISRTPISGDFDVLVFLVPGAQPALTHRTASHKTLAFLLPSCHCMPCFGARSEEVIHMRDEDNIHGTVLHVKVERWEDSAA